MNKKTTLLIFSAGLALLLNGCACCGKPDGVSATKLKVASYNIQMSPSSAGEKTYWPERRDAAKSLLAYHRFDIWGSQETYKHQIDYVMPDGYGYIGVGRDDGATKGEYAPIFYNKAKLEVLKSGTFWISETPDVVSYGWDETKYHRIVTSAILTEKESGIRFRVTATHMPLAATARANGAKLIVERELARGENIPSFLLGDMNAPPDDAATTTFGTCWTNCYDAIPLEEHVGPQSTYNGHNLSKDLTKPESRIDYVYFRGAGVTPLNYKVDDTKYNGVWTSDHFPVSVDFKIERTSDNQK